MTTRVNRLPISRALTTLMVACLMQAFVTSVAAFTPKYHPEMEITKTAGKIEIDGQLNDSGWRGLPQANNFAEHNPGDQVKPPVETFARMTYDDDHLYVSFVCHDDPSAIRASMTERERIFNDDNVVLLLDTYGDAAWAYSFNVNPYGIQADAMWNPNTGEDGGFDLIWESAAAITDSGYQVEMAIPFSALRFPNKPQQEWRVDFFRNHPREARRSYSWAAYDRNESCWPCRWGTVTGIEGVRPGKGIEVMPTVVGFQTGALENHSAPYDFNNEDPDGELSIGGKYSLTSDITFEGTYNPDFSQIEADAGQIDVNSQFALFYPERRPFFQEGADLFRTLFNSFYTRTINNPEFAGKMTVRKGKTSIGYLVARDENTPIMIPSEEFSMQWLGEKSTTNVFRVRQSVGRGSQIGVIATDRRLEGDGFGSVIATDGRLQFTRSLSLAYQAVLSHTDEADDSTTHFLNGERFGHNDEHTMGFDGESYWGTGGVAVLRYNTRNWSGVVNYWQVSPTYRADNGYDPKNNRRDLTISATRRFYPESELFESISTGTDFGGVWNFTGLNKNKFIRLNLNTNLKVGQLSTFTQYSRRSRNYRGVDYDDIWSVYHSVFTRLSDAFAVHGDINFGRWVATGPRAMGKMLNFSFSVDIKPSDRVLIEQWLDFSKSNLVENDAELWKGHIYRNRLSVQGNRNLSIRLVTEYNNFSKTWSVDPLITYRVNAFSKLYVGATHDFVSIGEPSLDRNGRQFIGIDGRPVTLYDNKLASRQFFMKLQYLFQI